MTSIDPVVVRKVSEDSVRLAGSFLRLMSIDNIEVFRKQGKLISSFDIEAERLIRNTIAMSYPEHKIVTDFSSSSESDTAITWFCDPLDGTKAFMRGQLAFVCLSVAAVDSTGIIAASIYNPFTDVLYSASRSEGVFLNEKTLSIPEDIPLDKARVLIDFSKEIPHPIQNRLATGDLSGDIGRIFRFDGSIAQHMALIAQGTLDGALIWGTGKKGNYWDIAAALLLLEKLNFKCTDLTGKKITAKSHTFDQLVIGQTKLHGQMLDYITKIGI
jgi:myo-inositol-1(or 4)-monophosphatase